MKLSITILLWRRSQDYIWKGTHHIFMDICNYFIFLIFRRENISHIINTNIRKPIYHTYNIDSMWLTCGGSVNAGVIINFSSYNAVPMFQFLQVLLRKEVWLKKLIYNSPI